MKEEIDKYKISGKIYAWTYKDSTRNYPGWNFTVDTNGSKSLLELLNLMSTCEWSTKKKITTELPTQAQLNVPNNVNAKWKSAPTLTLTCKKTESKNHWVIKESDNGIEIQFGESKLTELQNAIEGIPKWKGDFALSDQCEENILYLWWNLEM